MVKMTVKELSSEVKTAASAVSCLHSCFPLKALKSTFLRCEVAVLITYSFVKFFVENGFTRLAERETHKGLSQWLSGVLLTCRLYKMDRLEMFEVIIFSIEVAEEALWGFLPPIL